MSSIHLDLPGSALAQLDWPLPDIIAGQGVSIPAGVQFGEGPMPVAADGFADKGWGPVLTVLTDPAKAVATATAVSMIVLALSQFLTDRAHQPKLLVLHEVTETVAPDGSVTRRRAERPVLIEPGPQLEAELTVRLEQGTGLVIEFRFED
jgi:hypothetical protein